MENSELLLCEYLSRSEMSNGYPMLITIEATNNCNLGCIMCPRELQTHGRGFMSMELFKKIVDESAGLTKFMWLHYMGEPLMNKDIFEMIDYASERGILVGISSNGTMLTEKNIERLVNSKLHLLIVSIDAVTPETFEAVRKGGVYFDRIETGCENLLQSLRDKKSEMYVSIQFVNQEANKHEANLFREKWGLYESERVNITVKHLTDWGSQQDYTELGLPKRIGFAESCTEPHRTLIIHWSGKVSACCFDYDNKHNLGDVNTQTIHEIWNGQPLRDMRKGFKSKSPVGICATCSGINSGELFKDEFKFYKNPTA